MTQYVLKRDQDGTPLCPRCGTRLPCPPGGRVRGLDGLDDLWSKKKRTPPEPTHVTTTCEKCGHSWQIPRGLWPGQIMTIG